jgi:heme exporter protein C
LHQGASVSVTAAPKMASVMLLAMLLMTLSFWAYAFAVIFVRTRAISLERDNHAAWAKDAVVRTPQRQGA